MIRMKILLLVWLLPLAMQAKDTPNSRQARQMFDRTYQMVFGPQGCTLHYKVNIIGIYKTEGTIWYKGDKSKFIDERYIAWNDGTTYYRVERKKKTVTVYGANDEKRDKYATKFTFVPDNYEYNVEDSNEGYVITIRAKKNVKGIKLVKALIDKKTRNPISLRIKLGIIWTTVHISNFKSGGIPDNTFVYPAKQYKDYQWIDNR